MAQKTHKAFFVASRLKVDGNLLLIFDAERMPRRFMPLAHRKKYLTQRV
jgi:hypothetical protein